MQMIYDSDSFVVLHLTPEMPLSADGATVSTPTVTRFSSPPCKSGT